MAGRLDRDTAALGRREAANAAGAAHDLEVWILAHTRPAPGQRVLDLGCGRGKQVFAVAPHVVPGGSVLGVDISTQAVSEVRRRAEAEGLEHVTAIELHLDACCEALSDRRFDLLLSAYALYYATDVVGLIRCLHGLLAAGGQAFFCGYAAGTNREMVDLVNVAGAGPAAEPIGDWLAADQIAAAAEPYAGCEVVRLDNQVTFPTAADVLAWWRNHNSYVPDREPAVRKAVEAMVKRDGAFVLTKNVLGVHLHA